MKLSRNGVQLKYVVITPARNEASHIRLTLESVVSQTRVPLRWVVVSDGSTDRTDSIVQEYADLVDWIELVRLPAGAQRTFAAKVHAFNAGLARVQHLPFDVIASLDADISFEPRYFEFLLSKLTENPRLGVTGTPFVEEGQRYDYRFTNIEHVSGACQVFRRECFEQIGGYVPIDGGGIDWTAVTTARMKGWQTRTFLEMTCTHHRPMGTGSSRGRVRALYRHGRKDYRLGNHPAWQLFRGVYQMTRRPFVIGGAALLIGYVWQFLASRDHPVSAELVAFIRGEQMARLRTALYLDNGDD